ncbi:N-acetylmuramoyl-L-alanine amidase family protein [Terriglobus aquaticus]|uniref:N-acetylmuramoyl-L-alanine amidase n=1 Tax=Terriglobus aquaticus TaxID=940139 RepID=A0ABW9KHR4_9BACT|nr:N-acetylmuramoyl-L-alanine amidase [Terriglobus aquaticus]
MRRSPLILLGALATLPCLAQQPTQPQKLTIVLDPARGGSEYGARIDTKTYEKQVTLDIANRLRALLVARDFNVVLTRDSDALVTNEQRAAVANQSKAIACVSLHATAAGNGLHLWTSSVNAMPVGSTAVLWDEAQAPFVQRSQRLASEFAAAFSRSKIAVSSGHTWIRPLDNMQCPAVALEIAPEDSDTVASDRTYQAHLADAIASQMVFWRGHADVVQSILNPPPPPAAPKPATPESAAGAGKTAAHDTANPVTPARTRTAPAPVTPGTAAASPATRTTPATTPGEAPQ